MIFETNIKHMYMSVGNGCVLEEGWGRKWTVAIKNIPSKLELIIYS